MKKWYPFMMVLSLVVLMGIGLFNWQAQSWSSSVAPGSAGQTLKGVSPKEALDLIKKNSDNPNFVILDVRTSQEFQPERISGAKNIDFYSNTFTEQLNQLDKNKIYLIYCLGGVRSGGTLGIMKDLGFKTVYDLQGGIASWKRNGLPSVGR
jgi:rhodanese-related sulfurtransferase